MVEGIATILAYTLIPCLAIIIGGIIATAREPGVRLISSFQHFAAGVVFAAVAVELMPQLHAINSPIFMIGGFILGIAVMLASNALFDKAGIVIPMVVDLFVDGLLVAVGFGVGMLGGIVLLIGLTLETLALGLSTAPAFRRRGMSRRRAVLVLASTGLAILVGAAVGQVAVGSSGHVLASVLGFGVAALLYLVTEELLTEAHKVTDTPIITATFFAGFLVPIIIATV